MRGVDLIPVVVVGALATFVATQVLNAPGRRDSREPVVRESAEGPRRPTPIEAEVAARAGQAASVEDASFSVLPPRDASLTARRIAAGSAGTYLAEMLLEDDSVLVRWPARVRDPVRVWVDRNPGLADFRMDLPGHARRGMAAWDAAGVPVRFVFLLDSTDADIRVTWLDRFEDERVGYATRRWNQDGWVLGGEIQLAIRTATGELLDSEWIVATAAHEAGHMLGLNHSSDSTDLMSRRQHGITGPSKRDQATLRLLYTLDPGRVR